MLGWYFAEIVKSPGRYCLYSPVAIINNTRNADEIDDQVLNKQHSRMD